VTVTYHEELADLATFMASADLGWQTGCCASWPALAAAQRRGVRQMGASVSQTFFD
jgi:hypothetical protein